MHAIPTPEQAVKLAAVETAAREFARVVMKEIPPGQGQDHTLERIRDAMLTANAAILGPQHRESHG